MSPFEEVDVSSNREAAMEMVKKTRQMGVPVTQINERFIVGLMPPRSEGALKDAGIVKGVGKKHKVSRGRAAQPAPSSILE
jgi:hypothetical protein